MICHIKLECRQQPTRFVDSAANQIASLHYRRSGEDIWPNGEPPTDKQPTAIGNILKQAVLDSVALPAVDRTAISHNGELPSAMGEHVETWHISLRGINRRPDGKTVVSRASSGTIHHSCAAHSYAEINAIRQRIPDTATVYDQAL